MNVLQNPTKMVAHVAQLTEAINDSIPKTTQTKFTKSSTTWWNAECEKDINNRKEALKTLKKHVILMIL